LISIASCSAIQLRCLLRASRGMRWNQSV